MMNTHLASDKEKVVAHGLSSILADTYTLYLQTQNFHWNVTGPRFHQLHSMFEEHYKEMSEAVDEIAERVRTLGFRAPGTFKEFLNLTSIKEDSDHMNSDEMITTLIEHHDMVAHKAKEIIPMAENVRDTGTVDLLSARIKTHEKTAWMLRSFLQ